MSNSTHSTKSLLPSIAEVAFDCPHCGVYTTQTWFTLHAEPIDEPDPIPDRPDRPGAALKFLASFGSAHDMATNISLWESGAVFVRELTQGRTVQLQVYNANMSRCFACGRFALWIADQLVFPPAMHAPPPNPDLSDDIRGDYIEARQILNLSPRGAAALLRLAIQRLCRDLGEKGKNIDDDIGALVRKGLNPMVQQALDTVRVIGNAAVHPGELDLKDDRETAAMLFDLVNVIAEQMISNPKRIADIYTKIPKSKRDAIAKRDRRTVE